MINKKTKGGVPPDKTNELLYAAKATLLAGQFVIDSAALIVIEQLAVAFLFVESVTVNEKFEIPVERALPENLPVRLSKRMPLGRPPDDNV